MRLRRLVRTYGPDTWRRLLYLLVGLPVGALGFGYATLATLPWVPLSVTVLGLAVLAAGVVGARGCGGLHRALLRRLLGVPIEAPPRFLPKPGLIGWVRSGLTDAAGWRSLLYLALKLPLNISGLYLTAAVWTVGLGYLTYPLWWWLLPEQDRPATVEGFSFDTWPRVLLLAAAALLLVLAAPWVTRAAVWPDVWLARALLSPMRASRLRRSRSFAVDDAAARLRQIERDLHDGAQAQLVALAMTLGLAKEELGEGDTEAALALVDTAHTNAKQAIVELRDLARGIHPPVLDSGLEPALHTLATRSAVPVELHIDLPGRPSPAIETITYFTATELLTNIAKHSYARRATLVLVAVEQDRLRLTVSDDGVGGARPGGGLAGLAARIGAVDGRIELTSPPGGPTVVVVELPVRA